MWQIISEEISKALGEQYQIRAKQLISGGDTNQNYRISDGTMDFFVKINDKNRLEQFDSEVFSLEQLRRASGATIPHVITRGVTLDKSYLVLEHLTLSPAKNQQWLYLGVQLAKLHKNSSQQAFGFDQDNFIGNTPQPNRWHKCWASFFAEQRIGWQLQLLEDKGESITTNIETTVEQIKSLLRHHKPEPVLVHGDLWQGNIGFLDSVDERCALFDPACYYGDREVDIAMTELFGKFPDSFYQGYQQSFELSPGYNQRKLLYNLYHILNHANLFQGVYLDQARYMLKELF
jgi:fructosamine-3-kinase